MKTLKYIALAALPLLWTGCTDTAPEGTVITDEQKTEAHNQIPARIAAGVNGVMANFQQLSKVLSSGHSDFGYPASMLIFDTRGIDMVSSNIGYNWFRRSLTYADVDYTSTMNQQVWGCYYNQISSANGVIGTVDAATTDPTAQFYLAEALAVRAFDYFQLAQIYQHTYTHVDPATALCVPLITEKNKDVVREEGAPRATVKEVYDQVLSDLNTAVKLFESSGKNRSDKRYVDESVARGIRARVYLVMNDWKNAQADAEWVIANSGATPSSLAEASMPAFCSLSEGNWLWGIKTEETDEVVTSGIVNFPSHMGTFNYGYAAGIGSSGAFKRVNKKLFNSIPATDARRAWFTSNNNGKAEFNSTPYQTDPTLVATLKAYIQALGCPVYTQTKFAPYKYVYVANPDEQQSTNASDVPIMRIEEMYYIKAEAQAMGGDIAGGLATLNNFVKTYRDPAYNFTATTATAVQDEIWHQRRIEFWGEGLAWFDLQRLWKNFDRRGGGYGKNEVFNIPAGDAALIYRIPQNEMQYNKQIKDEQNNPAGNVPTPVADVQ